MPAADCFREMKGYTAQQIREAEVPLLAAGVPLMDRAADALAALVAEVCPGQPVLMLVGSGNNGGDALYAGAKLSAMGVGVLIVPVAAHLHADGLRDALASGASICVEPGAGVDQVAEALTQALKSCAVVVDAIVGTGAKGRLREPAHSALALVKTAAQQSDLTLIAVDIPSGINPDTGEVWDHAVPSFDYTMTFGAPKAGLLLDVGKDIAGDVRIADIGLGAQISKLCPVVDTDPHSV